MVSLLYVQANAPAAYSPLRTRIVFCYLQFNSAGHRLHPKHTFFDPYRTALHRHPHPLSSSFHVLVVRPLDPLSPLHSPDPIHCRRVGVHWVFQDPPGPGPRRWRAFREKFGAVEQVERPLGRCLVERWGGVCSELGLSHRKGGFWSHFVK
jgi:hypothetical protein